MPMDLKLAIPSFLLPRSQAAGVPSSRFERMREKREAEQEQREAQREARSAVTQKKLADEAAAFAAAMAPVPDFKVNFHDSLRKKSCAIQRQPQQPFDAERKRAERKLRKC